MKKILAIVLGAILVATLAVSGTLAFLVDTSADTNTMALGNVSIKLHEHQRELTGGNPTPDGKLVEFSQNKQLMPIVQGGGTDGWGLSTDKNYVDKIVRVENTGKSEAYVRIFIAIPSALENVNGFPALHWDYGYVFNHTKADSASKTPYHEQFDAPERVAENFEYNGVLYNIYCFTRKEALAPTGEDMTAAVMAGFYLDPMVDFNDEINPSETPYYPYYLGDKIPANQIRYDLSKGVEIPVYAQAIQAENFPDVYTAFNGADGKIGGGDDSLPGNPWAAN